MVFGAPINWNGGIVLMLEEDEYDSNQLKTILNNFVQEYGDINDVMASLKQFTCLWEENLLDSLFTVHQNWQETPIIIKNNGKINFPESLVLTQAIKNGIRPGINSQDLTVGYESFRNLYIFLEKLYSHYLGRNLIEDDLWALYKSDLVERILGALEQFNVFKGTLFLKNEFFKQLNHVVWDHEAELFFMKFQNLLISFLFEKQGSAEKTFNSELKSVIILLAHSSAILSDSHHIKLKHILRSYKTVFLIMGVDITNFVDKRYYGGYVVCDYCNESYKLLEHEAPSDFSTCSCGGDLKYLTNGLCETKMHKN